MAETILKGCGGVLKWHWYSVQSDLVEQGGLDEDGLSINPLLVHAHGCAGTYKENPFVLTWVHDAFMLLSMGRFDQDLVEESDFTAASAYEAAGRLLSRLTPDALIGVSDLLAIGALKQVLERGFKVPGDMVIAGYDNIVMSSLVSPQLTTVAEPIELMAKEAINILLKKMQGVRVKITDIVLDTRLIIRESTDIEIKAKILM